MVAEAGRAFEALTLYTNLFVTRSVSSSCLLAWVLGEKRERALNRVFQLLGLILPPGDISVVATALAPAMHGIARMRWSCSTTCSPATSAAA